MPARQGRKRGSKAQLLVETLNEWGPRVVSQLKDDLKAQRTAINSAVSVVRELNGNDAISRTALKEAQVPETFKKQVRGNGPHPYVYALGWKAGGAIGIDIGFAHVTLGCTDPNGWLVAVKEREHMVEKSTRDETFEVVSELLAEAREELPAEACFRTVALSVPGPVDAIGGRTLSSSVLPTFHKHDLRPLTLNATRAAGFGETLEPFVVNDADAVACGEGRWGQALNLSNFVAIKVSAGVGAGVMIGGEILSGRKGQGAAEIGHCRVPIDGVTLGEEAGLVPLSDLGVCRCHQPGHVEAYAGGQALVTRLELSGLSLPGDSLNQQVGELIQKARADDERCSAALRDSGILIGRAAHSLLQVFNPERILVCGKLSEAGDSFRKAVVDGCAELGCLIGDPEATIKLGTRAEAVPRRHITASGAASIALHATEPALVLPDQPE
jgi:predicted NBD/HSP70 family sugar kinase